MESNHTQGGTKLVKLALREENALEGDYHPLKKAGGVILFAHGTGNSRRCPRNQHLTARLCGDGFSTLLIDLLTPEEKVVDAETRRPRFDITRLGERIARIVDWLTNQPENQALKLGCLGSSTAAAAALIAAEARPDRVQAVVSLSGRVDMAASILDRIRAPTLCIAGEYDYELLALNRRTLDKIQVENRLGIIRGAKYLVDKPDTLDAIADLTRAWFVQHLSPN